MNSEPMRLEQARLADALAARYEVLREIGTGGMARVYLARDVRHGREVAIKVLRAEVANSVGAERFLREIAVTAGLDHPNIVPLLDSGDVDGLLYYVMPFVRGESLRDRMTRERQLPMEDALEITREVSDALAYAHKRQVVHRDIKPENILLSDGRVRIADFGIARAVAPDGGQTLTGTGIVVGSPSYMSPEQSAGERDIDGRCDEYALGCVLFEMLAGQPPFSGPTQESLMRQHLISPPPDVIQLRPSVQRHVSEALTRALSKAPADRFSSITEFLAALRATPGASVATRAEPVKQAAPRSLRTVALVAVPALAIAVVVWTLNSRAGQNGRETGKVAATTAAESSRPLVAVLPFRNIGAADDEYFADGLTEEITSRLGSISGIGTISRTTALTYKGSAKPLREIARELGVTFILEGTVRTDRSAAGGGAVRVTPELVRASDDTPIWTNRLTASLAPGELFAVQAAIAESVATAFNVSLLDRERQLIQRTETVDPAAHTAYLQGRFNLAKSTDVGLLAAIKFFEEAVGRDPNYARAWAATSTAYAGVPYFPDVGIPDVDAFAKAAAAARRAIAADSTLAEGHTALAAVLADGDWNWEAAETALREAQRLDPDNATVRTNHATLLINLERYEDALAEVERAIQLEPASPGIRQTKGQVLVFLGRLDEAEESVQMALRLQPDYVFPHIWLAEIQGVRRDIPAMGRALQNLPPMAEIGRALTGITSLPESRRSALKAISNLRSPNPGLDAARRGWILAAIGENDRALDEFEFSIRDHSPGGVSALRFPTVQRALRDTPRYKALLKTVSIGQGTRR